MTGNKFGTLFGREIRFRQKTQTTAYTLASLKAVLCNAVGDTSSIVFVSTDKIIDKIK